MGEGKYGGQRRRCLSGPITLGVYEPNSGFGCMKTTHGSKVCKWVEEFREQQTNAAGDLLTGQPAVMKTSVKSIRDNKHVSDSDIRCFQMGPNRLLGRFFPSLVLI
jgi:hypothetical protein